VREFFDGMRADLTITRYDTWPELRHYCHLVAGTVGLIVAPILGDSANNPVLYSVTGTVTGAIPSQALPSLGTCRKPSRHTGPSLTPTTRPRPWRWSSS
jgi:hypothetical protein